MVWCISCLPLPIPDSSRPWGSQCSEYKGCCCGHFLKPAEVLQSSLKPTLEPPFAILGAAHTTNLEGKSPSESLIEELVKQTLLPPGKVRWWFSHLDTTAENRRRGAQKAAATHRLRKLQARNTQNLESELYDCGVCHQQYVEYTDKVERWIACDSCDKWYHFTCVGLVCESEIFICKDVYEPNLPISPSDGDYVAQFFVTRLRAQKLNACRSFLFSVRKTLTVCALFIIMWTFCTYLFLTVPASPQSVRFLRALADFYDPNSTVWTTSHWPYLQTIARNSCAVCILSHRDTRKISYNDLYNIVVAQPCKLVTRRFIAENVYNNAE